MDSRGYPMQSHQITKISPEMVELAKILQLRDVISQLSNKIDSDINQNYKELSLLCDLFEKEMKILDNIDNDIIGLINCIKEKSKTTNQCDDNLQEIYDKFTAYANSRITSIPNLIDYESQSQFAIEMLDQCKPSDTQLIKSNETLEGLRDLLVTRKRLSRHNTELHQTVSKWFMKCTRSAEVIESNLQNLNNLIGAMLKNQLSTAQQNERLNIILQKIKQEESNHPPQPEQKEQHPKPAIPAKKTISPGGPIIAPTPRHIQGLNSPIVTVNTAIKPSAPPLEVHLIHVAEKSSSQKVLNQLNNPQALIRTPESMPLVGGETPPRISNSSNNSQKLNDSPQSSAKRQSNNINTAMPVPSAPELPSAPRPKMMAHEGEEGEQTKFGNMIIPKLKSLRAAEKNILKYLENKKKYEGIGIRYNAVNVESMEATVLYCEKNNLAYDITHDPGCGLDKKYSNHQDPTVKSIFAYLDQHFTQTVASQLSPEALKFVMFDNHDEKAEAKAFNYKKIPSDVLLEDPILPAALPVPASKQGMFKKEKPTKEALIIRAQDIKEQYAKSHAEEEHKRNYQQLYLSNPNQFPRGCYFDNPPKVSADLKALSEKNQVYREEYAEIREQLKDLYKLKITEISDKKFEQGCCVVM